MHRRGELGVGSVCCLLHNLIVGGSAWQWIHLLGRHVEHGGRATIFAPPGPLAEPAQAAGIEVVPTSWGEGTESARADLRSAIARHDVAIVHWDHQVMDQLLPALELCGRAALVMHQAPYALARWFGPEILVSARVPIEVAAAQSNAVALVRGESHRRRIAAAFDVDPGSLRILPASIPLAEAAFRPAPAEPEQVLALMRMAPDKEAVARLAVELAGERLRSGRPCRLTIAGDGPWQAEAAALCEKRLPHGSWHVEGAPEDRIARLAAADMVVAQGLTTLEAVALGRRVVVAKAMEDGRPGGIALRPDRYEEAARDPFGQPPLSPDPELLWAEALAVGADDLRSLRRQVEQHNGLAVASRALGEALETTSRRARWRWR